MIKVLGSYATDELNCECVLSTGVCEWKSEIIMLFCASCFRNGQPTDARQARILRPAEGNDSVPYILLGVAT
jgi:hypothetical protein